MTTIAPPSAGPAEARIDAAAAERLDAVPAALPAAAWLPALAPAAWLPVLAWSMSLDVWSSDWSITEKRLAIAAAIESHRLKGTAAGVKAALDRIGAAYTYTERPGGKAFTAEVAIRNPSALRLPAGTTLRDIVDSHKRGTVVMTITTGASLSGAIPVAGGLAAVAVARLDLADAGL